MNAHNSTHLKPFKKSVSLLVIEDSRLYQEMIRSGLEELGYDISCAGTLKEAREILDRQMFDFILLDLHLPDGSSETLLPHINSKPDSKVIVLTGSEETMLREKLFEEGILDYFSKLNKIETIIENIHHLIYEVVHFNAHRKIMMVGSDPSVFDSIKSILARRKHPITLFSSLDETSGLSAYQLAVIDVHNCDKDPIEFIKKARTDKSNIDFPIILIDRNTNPANTARWIKAGANDVIHYPFVLEQLLLKSEQLIATTAISDMLRKQEYKYRLLAENSTDLILKYDISGIIKYASPAAFDILGILPQHILGKEFYQLVDPEDQKSFAEENNTWESGTTTKTLTFRTNPSSGESKWLEASIRPVYLNQTQKFSTLQASIRDVSKRKQLEEEIIKRSRQAATGEIISTLSHQWRQPITRMSMIANNIQLDIDMDSLETQELQKGITGILAQITELSEMIDYFRQAFSVQREKKALDLRQLAQTVLDSLHEEISQLNVNLSLSDTVSPQVMANRTEIMQVLRGVIKNSLEAFVSRKIANPSLQIAGSLEDGFATLRIRDNAGGIDDKILQSVFEPYSGDKGNIGSGIGLYITRVIVEEHHKGRVSLENTRDGVETTLRLPLE